MEEEKRGPGRPPQPLHKKRAEEIRRLRERAPVRLDGMEQKLAAKIPDGFKGRWVNDTQDGRIAKLESRGYAKIDALFGAEAKSTDLGSNVSQVVGAAAEGGAQRAYLMVIPEEIHAEDQKAKLKEADKIDEAIRRGSVSGKPGEDGRYIPKDGIALDHGRS